MNDLHIRRLAVVDEDGCLLGIVSRRDLLSVFLRPDGDVAAEVREIFDEVLHAGPGGVTITVKDGIVVLTGPLGADRDLVAFAIRLAWASMGSSTSSTGAVTPPAAQSPLRPTRPQQHRNHRKETHMSGIIVGVDGSGHSQRALEWAAREAALRRTSLTVLTVHQALAGWAGGPVTYPGDQSDTEHARELAQAETDKALEAIGTQRPAEVTVRAVHGLPAQELLSAADGAEMLVIGTRGAGGFTHLMLGSVSSQVTHHATCPVVVIPAGNRQ